jgi:hypothetical protein
MKIPDAECVNLRTILEEIKGILLRSDYFEHAKYVRSVIEMLKREDPGIQKELASLDFWGGSGALWDAFPPKESGDVRRFAALIAELADAVIRLGIAPKRPAFIAATLRDWLRQDVWTAIEKGPRNRLRPFGKPESKESLKPQAKRNASENHNDD